VVNLPPLIEQREILCRAESLFKLADQLDNRFAKARTFAGKLTPSLLAKAFRGELVPTEAVLAEAEVREFESAAQLLARMKSLSKPVSGNGAGPHRTGRKLRARLGPRTSTSQISSTSESP